MPRLLYATLLSAALFAITGGTSLADDWTAVRLRGEVFVYHDGWVKLERGDVVSDESIIRTLGRGRVSFERDAETIELLPNSQIRIVDQTGRQFTTVMHDYGEVAIEAEVQNVEHFAVATPFLAAVVKGTRFSVSSDSNGSEVDVERGQVFVEDSTSHDTVTIVAGQTASTSSSGDTALIVTGTPKVSAPALTVGVTAGDPTVIVDTPVSLTGDNPTPPPQPPTGPGDSDDDGPGGNDDNGNHYGHDKHNDDNGNSGRDRSGDDHGNNDNNGNNGNHNGHDKHDNGRG